MVFHYEPWLAGVLILSKKIHLFSFGFCFCSLFRREHKSCEFEMHEAYAIDIIVSSGEGKVRKCYSDFSLHGKVSQNSRIIR